MTPPNVAEHLGFRARQHPDAEAFLVEGAPGLTFAQWDRASNSAARALRVRGVHRGVRVGLYFTGSEWAEFAVCYLGLLKAGGTAVHLSGFLGPEEQERRLAECRAAGLVHGAAAPPAGFGGWSAAAGALAGQDEGAFPADLRPEDLADILYTSGTTGRAKAQGNPHALLSLRRPATARDPGQPPVVHPVPLGTTAAGSAIAVAALTAPAQPVLCRPEDVEPIAALAARVRAGAVLLTPWQAARFVADRVHDRHDLSALRAFNIASAPLPPAVAEALLAMVPGARVNLLYTQSEAVPRTVFTQFDAARPFAVGRPGLLTEVRVAGPAGEPVGAGEVGEIWLGGPGPRRAYLDPALNGAGHDGGDPDWIRTGDLGWLDADGVLNFFDRRADAVPTAEGLVSTVAVEAALYAYPAVREAAVVARPVPGGGSQLCAFVVADGPVSGLAESLAGRLAPHQLPARIQTVAELPRGVSGKVLKRVLRESGC